MVLYESLTLGARRPSEPEVRITSLYNCPLTATPSYLYTDVVNCFYKLKFGFWITTNK